MEWLDDDNREKLRFSLDNTLSAELENKCWGSPAPQGENGINKYLIRDLRGLNYASGLIRYTLKSANARVIYRGQDRDYPLLPSLYRTCSSRAEAAVLEKRLDRVLDIISDVFYPSAAAEERELVCQHYGMPTRFLDVADTIQTALWFAYDRTMVSKDREALSSDDMGFINILALPDDARRVKVVDLRSQSPDFLRIHSQQAFALKKAVPGEDMGLFSSFIAAKFMIPRELLRKWSNYDNIPFEYMFPPESMDRGPEHWEAAKSRLREEGIEIEKYLRLHAE